MYLDLMDVLRTPSGVTERPISIAPQTLDDIEIVAPVHGVVRAANARRNIVISGRAQTAVRMNCSRCLQPYSQPLDLELEASVPISFFRGKLNGAKIGSLQGEVETDEEDEIDDETAAIFDAHSVDVLELIRQAIVLQSPIKPLCSEDCPGLPEAQSYQEADDVRWSALEKWRSQSEGSENGAA
ncbi:MAG: hypothetical protein JWN98_66 [Abditibacteriota bacterium]|jgi:uncharacterized protein|nr:hypothetical protein [Abditibacteriota bacterium]